ncbi:hypothetical protein GWI33_013883 [Rhynchophorus ferrugineus]|uniref:Uncharacterized protein n=1 Tax=Rhynchophorus ferrugineus TaxID=354439 RepID=A0A834MB59_RHYFE|nr:hypothetical protein GWI33_013883 [Rhynchophorus ferrugineus]
MKSPTLFLLVEPLSLPIVEGVPGPLKGKTMRNRPLRSLSYCKLAETDKNVGEQKRIGFSQLPRRVERQYLTVLLTRRWQREIMSPARADDEA